MSEEPTLSSFMSFKILGLSDSSDKSLECIQKEMDKISSVSVVDNVTNAISDMKDHKDKIKDMSEKEQYWYPTLDILLNRRRDNNIIISREVGEVRQYSLFRDCTIFAKYLYMQNPNDRHFHEIIRDVEQKPYLDIDMLLENGMTIETYAEPLVNSIKQYILSTYPQIKQDQIMVFTSNGETEKGYKASYHIILDGCYVINHEANRSFWKKVLEPFPEWVYKYIDLAIYKSGSSLRTWMSSKLSSSRVKSLSPLSGWKINPDSEPKFKFYETIKASLITHVIDSADMLIDLEVNEHKKAYTGESEDISGEDVKEILTLLNIPSLGVLNVKDGMIILKNYGGYFCKLHNTNHQAENPYITVSKGKAYFYCRRETDKGKGRLLGKYKDSSVEAISRYDFKENYYFLSYVKDVNGKIFEGKTEAEAKEKAKEFILPLLSKVYRVYMGASVSGIFKENKDSPYATGNHLKYFYGKYHLKWTNMVNDKGKPIDLLGQDLLTISHSDLRLTINRFVYQPYHYDIPIETEQEVLNTFPGFQASFIHNMTEEEAMEECKPVLDHLLLVVANGNKQIYEYILEWFAKILRDLERPGIMINLFGTQGTGKSFLFENFFIPFVFGNKTAIILVTLEAITKKFNKQLENKLLVVLDEAAFKGMKQAQLDSEILKGLITGNTLEVEPKGKDPRTIDNYMGIWLNTNHEQAHVISDKDRRNAVFHSSEGYVGKLEYFTNTSKLFNQRMGDAFYTYMRQMKVKCNIKIIPKTEARTEAITLSKVKEAIFFEKIKDGNITFIPEELKFKKLYVDKTRSQGGVPIRDDIPYILDEVLYRKYASWCQGSNPTGSNNFAKCVKSFGSDIFEYCPKSKFEDTSMAFKTHFGIKGFQENMPVSVMNTLGKLESISLKEYITSILSIKKS